MREKVFSGKSFDGLDLFGRYWIPDDELKGVIAIVHGLGDHSGRYSSWARRFNEQHYGVISIDLRGHGKSEGKRGHASRYKNLLKDVEVLVQKAIYFFPNIPVFLYGHSLGGNLAINYILSGNEKPYGLIVTSPWLKLAMPITPLELMLASAVRYLYPSLLVNNKVNPANLSHDLEECRMYREDDLVHDRISVRLFFDIQRHGLLAQKSIYKINIPLLVMHGDKDRVTSHEASQEFVQNTSKKTTFRIFRGMYHELHHELNNDEVFHFIHEWLEEVNLKVPEKIKADGYF